MRPFAEPGHDEQASEAGFIGTLFATSNWLRRKEEVESLSAWDLFQSSLTEHYGGLLVEPPTSDFELADESFFDDKVGGSDNLSARVLRVQD